MSAESIPIPKLPPWRILAVSDLTPGKVASGPYSVDKNTFSELVQKLFPTLFLTIPNKLGGAIQHIDINLSFSSLKDFSPESIITQIPELSNLLTFKSLIVDCCEGKISGIELSSSLKNLSVPSILVSRIYNLIGKPDSPSTQTPQQQKEKSDKIGNILSMLDIEEKEPAVAPSPEQVSAVTDFIQAISKGSQTDISSKDVESIINEADQLLTDQLDEIIHARAFLDLETSWRELKLLVDRTDFRKGAQIDVIVCPKDEIQKMLYDKAFRPVWKEGFPPYELVIISHPFSRIPPDQELIENLAQLAQNTQTLVCIGTSPRFFDVSDFITLEEEAPSIVSLIDGPGYENWRAFRDRAEAEWIAVATNTFCLRRHYGKSGTPLRSIQYEETPEMKNRPCGTGSIAVGAILAETIARLCTDTMEEIKQKPILSDLYTATLYKATGRVSQSCEAIWTDDTQWDMSNKGLIPLTCFQDRSELSLGSINTVRRDGVSIIKTLISARISHTILYCIEKYSGETTEYLTEIIRVAIKSQLVPKSAQDAQDAVMVTVSPNAEKSNANSFTVKVFLPYPIFGEEVASEVSFTL